MDAGDLRIFAAVARLGGMNRAAGALHTVQSNVTQRIRLLEAALGAPLFERHSRGVTLTAAGRRLLPYAERVAALIAEAERAVVDDGTPCGPLLVGSLETTAAMRLAPVLARYGEAHPAVDLALTTGTSAELVEAVLARRLEAAFVCGPVRHPELAEEVVFTEELVLVTAPSIRGLDALAKSGDLKIVVLRAGCSYRQRLEEILARRGVVGLRRLEFGSIDGLIACAGAGLGVTLLPRIVVAPALRAGSVAVHALPAREARVATMFIRRRDGYVSSALAAFLALARAPVAAAAE
ncbi:MAG TPA: LysR family transcriptional regulator [Stellaceae bacterium]|nr:LysR family transcriptional regulator [Stellaceae bacterium]